MAVIYSKLGGCLGDTAKLGFFSQDRPLCWCQRFAGKVNDPLRVGVFWGRPLREPIREVMCEIDILSASTTCLRGSAVALGSLEGLLPG